MRKQAVRGRRGVEIARPRVDMLAANEPIVAGTPGGHIRPISCGVRRNGQGARAGSEKPDGEAVDDDNDDNGAEPREYIIKKTGP